METYLKPSYERWRKRLAGEKVIAYTEPDAGDVGCYRLPIKERKQNAKGENNGQWKTVSYKPVLLGVMDGVLCCQIGDVVVSDDVRNDSWTSFVRHPITEDAWKAVAQRGEPWPDMPPADAIPAADRAVTTTDNTEPEQPLDVQHATAISQAIGASKQNIKAVTNNEEAALALGIKNRIAELRLLADKHAKSVYQPLHKIYTEAQKKLSAPIKLAEAEEDRLNTELLRFRERERLRIAAEQAEADQKQREADEANQRAADRAIAAGEPEPKPVVETVDAPVFEPVPIQPTYGSRGLREQVKKFAIIDDSVAVYKHFMKNQELIALLEKLATNAIRSGVTVPGASYREGLL